ncbi:chaperonin 10-like protein [Rhypophila decipiens]|uniref:Chaperonin 10-like protein n=1 Tax=Rhypophila decipiens TaxID=261697 RepID=A0AAN7BCZ4_9PEZI|nr:chaperonin 10-like protein [Rhypophila decipiens]
MTTTASLPAGVPATHPAVATVRPRASLEIIQQPTSTPGEGEVLVHVQWTSSSPLDLHQADGGLLISPESYPYIMGTSWAGVVVALGPSNPTVPPQHQPSEPLAPGDKVFGFSFRNQQEKGFQEYVTTATSLVGKIPDNITPEEAVTVPANLITAIHTLTADLDLPLPWPIPTDWTAPNIGGPILVWGAASSVGLYILQVLRIWGYTNTTQVIAVARSQHHHELQKLGATVSVDYNDDDVVGKILSFGTREPRIPLIVDCIGSREGTLRPLTRIAERGSKVAIMLPVINIHSSTEDSSLPEYEMDVSRVLTDEWKDGVLLKGTRTHFYWHNEFFKYHLQPEIVPALLKSGHVQPNKQRIVEGKTLLERAQNALDLLRERAPSGEKLVWRVAEE